MIALPIMMTMWDQNMPTQALKNQRRIATSAIQNQKRKSNVRKKDRRKSGLLVKPPSLFLRSESHGLSTLIITIRLCGTTISPCKHFFQFHTI